MGTKRLFWLDPYQKECEARVERIEGDKIYLDQTVFFAFSGGQESDSGTINSVPVKEAVEEGNYIYYILGQHSLKPRDTVKVRIDWGKRYKLMRLHSAVHIVYYAFAEKFGKQEMIGSNISTEKGRLDFSYPENISNLIPEVQKRANEIIGNGLDIKTGFSGLTERFWKVGEYEQMPCSGTHVKSTKEIGPVILKRKNIGAGKERIEVYVA